MSTSINSRICRKAEVIKLLAISRSTLHERINDGLLPPPIKLGRRAVGWFEHEIHQILKAMAAGVSEELIAKHVKNLVKDRTTAWDELKR